MYRKLTEQQNPALQLQIYCTRGEGCDRSCGKFHSRRRNGKLRDNMKAVEVTTHVEEQQQQSQENVENTRPKLMIVTSSPELGNGATLDSAGVNTLSLALPPVSPFPGSSAGSKTSLASQMSSLGGGSSVTLEDIIASARRKISDDYDEIRLPSPVFMDDQEDYSLWDKKAAKKRLLFCNDSSLDVPAYENGIGIDLEDLTHKYEDMDSEAELAIQEEPPSYIGDDDAEDFEEMIKASKPPLDAFSNPILLRDSDPLTMRKKIRRGGKVAAGLLRQQSLTRLHKLGELSGGNSRPSSNTASGEHDDVADSSSIDGGDSFTGERELSAMVAKSTVPSGSTSPSNILQFIEEQKQRTNGENGSGVGAVQPGEQPTE